MSRKRAKSPIQAVPPPTMIETQQETTIEAVDVPETTLFFHEHILQQAAEQADEWRRCMEMQHE